VEDSRSTYARIKHIAIIFNFVPRGGMKAAATMVRCRRLDPATIGPWSSMAMGAQTRKPNADGQSSQPDNQSEAR